MKGWKKIVSAALALSLTVGLCACGKGNSVKTVEKQAEASPSLAKEYVYRMEPIDLSGLQTDQGDLNVQGISKQGDTIYMMLQNYNYQEESGSEYEYMIASMGINGGTIKINTLEMPTGAKKNENGEEADGEGTPDQEAAGTDEDAEAKKVASGSADEIDDIIDEPIRGVYDSTYFNNFQISDAGLIYAMKSRDYSDYSDPENPIYTHEETVCCWNMEGALQWEASIDLKNDEESWHYANGLIAQKDGSVAIMVAGDDNGLITVDKDGNSSEMKQVKNLTDIMENYSGFTARPDGRLLVTYYDDSWENMYITTYDFATDQADKGTKLPQTVASNLYGRFVLDENEDVIYATSEGVFRYHVGADKGEQVMSFVNSDMYLTGFDAILPLEKDKFFAAYSEYDDTNYTRTLNGGFFTKVDPADIVDKKVLVLGGAYLYGDLQKRVVDYNKSSNEYKIVMRDYSKYNTNSDYLAGYTQLNNDIISGNMPDILVVDGYNMSLENYVSKGVLADIGAMIEKDEELSKIQYMDNIFDACKINGKLYEVIPSYNVTTYIGKKSVVGDRKSWTMAEAMDLMKTMPEGTQLFGEMTRSGFISTLMSMCGSQFVDISSGKCKFDTDEFISLMEYAKSLPEELGDDYYSDNWSLYQSQYRENRTILMNCAIYEFSDLVYNINGSFGEDVSYIGFPSANGNGSVVYTNTTYAIAAGSNFQDEAWKFLRYYLTDEYQKNLSYQLPVIKSCVEENAQKATKKPTYMEDGEEKEDNYYYWINDERIEIEPLSQEQAKAVVDFVSGVDRRAYSNNDVTNIINEEIEAYYKNQKSAKDVASLIQNRVQLYINENR